MYLLVLLLFLCVSGLSSPEQKPQDCFSYEPATITIKGEISRKTFAGRPNYESIKKGDEPETYWILHLSKSVCIDNGAKATPDDVPEKNVSAIQLILSEDQYARYKDLINKQVIVRGKLLHAISGHHHTKVIMEVAEIKGEGP